MTLLLGSHARGCLAMPMSDGPDSSTSRVESNDNDPCCLLCCCCPLLVEPFANLDNSSSLTWPTPILTIIPASRRSDPDHVGDYWR